MIALILKDIATLKKTLLLSLLIFIGINAYSMYKENIFMIPVTCLLMPIILTGVAFGYDIKSNFEKFAFSMPVKKSSYVLSKTFFPISFGLIGAISVILFMLIKCKTSIINVFAISFIILLFTVLVPTVQLPFLLKYGEGKSRLIMVFTFFAVFGILTTGLDEKLESANSLFLLFNKYKIIAISILILSMISIIVISLKISIKILENKEY